jgi:hypothetical protein
MYKVTLKGSKEFSGMDITQELEFKFDNFGDCRQFMELALMFSTDKNTKITLEKESKCKWKSVTKTKLQNKRLQA